MRMNPHIHTAAPSTLSHVGRVVEIGYATSFQALNCKAITKSTRCLLLFCGVPRIATPT
jgi:hypothetical protein